MKTLELLNVVQKKKSEVKTPYVDSSGLVIMPEALWAKDQIISYYKSKNLTPSQLNKSFHKSWKKIQNSSRFELFLEQILHYASTYGTDFQGETYIPIENLDIPEKSINVFVVCGISKKEIKKRLLNMLQSGIAMKQETISSVIDVLEEFGHEFSQHDCIKNKEAIVLIADRYSLYPSNPVEFLRYCIFKSTGKTLLIKNKETYDAIKSSSFNPEYCFIKYGVENLASIFNRFKPIFLSYKNKCPKVINKISKLSKNLHEPLIQSDLNFATTRTIYDASSSTIFALLRAWSAIHYAKQKVSGRVFSIRNGKSFVKSGDVDYKYSLLIANESKIINEIDSRIARRKIYIPENIDYSIPTSEKMFVGNFPAGTRFYGKSLAVGVYWENSWGARDIDLSGITEKGKVGWNSYYNQDNELLYSGDMANAENGAVEYLYSGSGNFLPTIVTTNVFNGEGSCEYNIVIGDAPEVSRDLMMDPNFVLAQIKCSSIQNQTILGLFYPIGDRQAFSVVNVGAGSARFSGCKYFDVARKVFVEKWSNCLTLRDALGKLDFEIAGQSDCDIDLSIDKVTKEKFISIFS